jgi:hypothetical protein
MMVKSRFGVKPLSLSSQILMGSFCVLFVRKILLYIIEQHEFKVKLTVIPFLLGKNDLKKQKSERRNKYFVSRIKQRRVNIRNIEKSTQ